MKPSTAWAEDESFFDPERSVSGFESVIQAVWKRAHRSLGEVTLRAVLERVLEDTVVRFPLLGCARITSEGIEVDRSSLRWSELSEVVVARSFGALLEEIREVLGQMTGQILTEPIDAVVGAATESWSALHAARVR